jgi:hypothetical protein
MSKDDAPANFDPMKAWRDWFLNSERDWSESITRLIKEDAVSSALGQELKAQLYQQKQFAKDMAGPMAMMNLPTRDEILALSERLGQLEDAVARVEALLVQRKAESASEAAKPPRTRTPGSGDHHAAE